VKCSLVLAAWREAKKPRSRRVYAVTLRSDPEDLVDAMKRKETLKVSVLR
jgi:hypothetical protein